MKTISDTTIPYFAWDRNMTAGRIRHGLATGSDKEKRSLAAWIMREAAFADVWEFMTPATAAEMLPGIERQLGKKRAFRVYIIGTWHELGKI